jgi:pentatricopeptide repeat protein
MKAMKQVHTTSSEFLIKKPKFIPNDLLKNTNSLLNFHFKQQNFEKAINVFQIFKKLEIHENIILDTVISGCVKCNKVEQAFELFNQISKEGNFKPTLYTYTNLINGCSKINEFKKMKELFDLMIENRMKPNVYTVTAMIKGLMKNKETVPDAEYIYERIGELGVKPNVFTIGSMLEGYQNHKRFDEFVKIISDFQKFKITPSSFIYQLIIRSGLVNQHEILKDFIAEYLTNQKMKNKRLRVLNIYIQECFHSKDLERIESSIQMLEDNEPDVVTFQIILNGFSRLQMFDKVDEYFQKMKEKKILPTIPLFTILLEKVFAKSQESEFQTILNEVSLPVYAQEIDEKFLICVLKCSVKFFSKPEIIFEFPIFKNHLYLFEKLLSEYPLNENGITRFLEIKNKMISKGVYPSYDYYLSLLQCLLRLERIKTFQECFIEMSEYFKEYSLENHDFLLKNKLFLKIHEDEKREIMDYVKRKNGEI